MNNLILFYKLTQEYATTKINYNFIYAFYLKQLFSFYRQEWDNMKVARNSQKLEEQGDKVVPIEHQQKCGESRERMEPMETVSLCFIAPPTIVPFFLLPLYYSHSCLLYINWRLFNKPQFS